MEQKPSAAKPWVWIILFVISLLVMSALFAYITGILLSFVKNGKMETESVGAVWQNLAKSGYVLPLLAQAAASFVTVYIFRKLVDRRSFHSLGFAFRPYRSSAAAGLFLGLLVLGIGTFILVLNRNLLWEDINFDARQLFIDFGLLLIIAFAEEIVFRGYILGNLLKLTNRWVALALSAVVFALFHINNPGMNMLPVINIFLAGLMLGINYIYTKNLWFSIVLHMTWNFYMGCILGYKVSGLALQSLFQQQLSGSALLTGGSFGFEGSVVESILCILTVITVGWVYEKQRSQL